MADHPSQDDQGDGPRGASDDVDPTTAPVGTEDAGGDTLDQGTYDVIRARLAAHADDLRNRLDRLDAARRDVFGAIETRLLATERVTTAHNCVPRDIVAIGDLLLIGFNVHFGLKTEIGLEDVLAAYRFGEGTFAERPLDVLRDPTFEKDFRDLYRFYRNATFARFFLRGPYLYLKFHVGRDPTDFKAFKFAVDERPAADGSSTPQVALRYVDNRSDHELTYPPQHEFRWERATRDAQRSGRHPHVSIADLVFVQTAGGMLTIKVENNTDRGGGIHEEPLEVPDQTLDDAEIHYAVVGQLVLLRIRPYQERAFRHFIYNARTQTVVRNDAVADAAVLLPDEHGVILANGIHLANGSHQTFPIEAQNMTFERRIAAPNGEDFLFVFYRRASGEFLLLPYNLIRQRLETPVACHGFCLFTDGELVNFRAQDEPQRHHALQVWQTPFVGPNVEAPHRGDSYLAKIGNRDIVRTMAECVELLTLIGRDRPYPNLYLDVRNRATALLDRYFWLDHEECHAIGVALREIRSTADVAIGEFEKVTRIRRTTAERTHAVTHAAESLLARNATRPMTEIGHFVEALAGLRAARGDVIGLRELRYADAALIGALDARIEEQSTTIGRRAVDFLLDPSSLDPYEVTATELADAIDGVRRVAEARELEERIGTAAGELELLIEVVGNLEIDDATQRTTIVDSISAIFTRLNTTRSRLRNRRQELGREEGIAEFASQIRLLGQSVTSSLDLCDTPERADELLTRTMVQIEELEARFAEFDEFIVELAEKRQEIANAFDARRLQLIERRNRRIESLATAAERILGGIRARVETFREVAQINAHFASDLMVDKVRDTAEELQRLGDSVKADGIRSQLRGMRDDAIRRLRDRQEIFEAGGDLIRFGRHRFSVNTQPIDLTTIVRDGRMLLHLSGTRYFETIEDPELDALREHWDREVVSESPDVYRAEYLAFLLLRRLGHDGLPGAEEIATADDHDVIELVRTFMTPRYAEGYVKGVHDLDAARIVAELARMSISIDLLRHSPSARALATVFWHTIPEGDDRVMLEARLRGHGEVRRTFDARPAASHHLDDLHRRLADFAAPHPVFAKVDVDDAAAYLLGELVREQRSFVTSAEATTLRESFMAHLRLHHAQLRYERTLEEVGADGVSVYSLAREWVAAFLERSDHPADPFADHVDEVAAQLLVAAHDPGRRIEATVRRELTGMLGQHPRIRDGAMTIHFGQFVARLEHFVRESVPAFQSCQQRKRAVLDEARAAMRLDEFKAKVLTSFVRNRLIDSVFLPLIGDNLAKQIGTAGEGGRSDRSGLLLLISPPGYGKTTLMEYVADRLGLVFVKVNGPAIGHQVTSLDPAEAPNAAAREELHRLNLALEMGDNVMLYVDDIQHCHSEFLQKFISLCDAQRRIEGVHKGRTRTYDFRGRKVAVVMAGNPYTGSGERFRIPDMLANRADTYNLGDIIGSHGDAFRLSYLENAMTSSPTLATLAGRAPRDIAGIVRIVETGSREGIELEGNHSVEEMNEFVEVTRKLLRVRDVVLRVNQEYIRSAGMEDQFRTEPPFLLQGSYRNMNRMTERVVPVMNDDELNGLILSSYEQDAQTLTTSAEANLLKFREMMGWLSPRQAQRWDEIKRTFARNNQVRSLGGEERAAAVITQLAAVNEGLGDLNTTLAERLTAMRTPAETTNSAAEGETAKAMGAAIGAAAAQADRIATALDAIGRSLASRDAAPTHAAAATLAQPAATLSQPAAAREPMEVRVINRVPETFLIVLKEQFNLMRSWLDPLVRLSTGQRAELDELRTALATLGDRYEQIIEQLERSAGRADEEPDGPG